MWWIIFTAVALAVPAGIAGWVLGHIVWSTWLAPRWRHYVARRLGRQAVRTIDLAALHAAFRVTRAISPLAVLAVVAWGVLTVTRRK